jgi:predicted glycogen debranching enzyme
MTEPRRSPDWSPRDPDASEPLLTREWLVTNGLGGYSSGTIAGAVTRRYHGLLVAALPAPLGRTVMLNHLAEELRLPDGTLVVLGGTEDTGGLFVPGAEFLLDFELELGLPVWRYRIGDTVIEKRVLMPHFHNTVHLAYSMIEGDGELRLRLRPASHFRSYESAVDVPLEAPYRFEARAERFELHGTQRDMPPLRMMQRGGIRPAFVIDPRHHTEVVYRVEEYRGYPAVGHLWSPGYFRSELSRTAPVSVVASTDPWNAVLSLDSTTAGELELQRRRRLISLAPPAARAGVAAELVLAADQFITRPAARVADEVRAHAAGRELRTVIAGYHWFTDWGRDTMIALEGLTLSTGRHREASYILRTFADYVRDGLLPNMFPDQSAEGVYHTADATLWFFHAVARYARYTGDHSMVSDLLPVFRDIVGRHLEGTHFGIGVDARDGLLRQGAEGYQLTWMDAKVDGWVVTPRRGKAVEINALWYNALMLMAGWCADAGDTQAVTEIEQHAARARAAFNERFWYPDGGYLYDVVDGEAGDDAAFRPNQIFAVALDHPVLHRERWDAVVDAVRERLLTPVGLRSLERGHADYQPRYWGDLRARDAAYHQGTVWGWLIGPFIDAWLRCHADDAAGARALLDGLVQHLDEFGVGTIAEIFDAEPPFAPRGCIAQAWSVAEALRCWLRTAD